MPELLPKGKIIHTPPKIAVHLQKLSSGSKSHPHITRQIPHHLAGQEGNMESLHTHKGTEYNILTHTPCFCSLQKRAVKNQQYCFLWEEGKGSWMQIFLGGGEGARQAQGQRSHLWDLGMCWEITVRPTSLSSTLTTFLCSQFALFHLPGSKTLLIKSSEVQLPEIQGAAVTLWHFLRLEVFYFSIKKVTFKISKSLNIDHEEQTMFQVSCTFP